MKTLTLLLLAVSAFGQTSGQGTLGTIQGQGQQAILPGTSSITMQDPVVVSLLSQLITLLKSWGPNVSGANPLTLKAQPVYEVFPPNSNDPCTGGLNKWNVPVSTNANVQLVSGVAGKPIHICGGILIATTAGSFSIVEGTGAVCATNILAVVGATTAASGVPVGANGGFNLGNGAATFSQSNVGGNNLCILLTGTGVIAGNIEVAF